MGIFSFLFSSNPKTKIVELEERIRGFKRNIEVIKKNTENKKAAHYHKSASENIKTIRYQIEQEQEKIKVLKRK